MSELWDQPELWDQRGIARAFGVVMTTVQSSWRNTTLRALREHVAEFLAGCPEGAADGLEEALGPVEQVSRGRWERIRTEYGMPALPLPVTALPLPDTVIGNKPVWTEATMRQWAEETKRTDGAGGLRRASPPGRPAGVRESGSRRRRGAAVVEGAAS